MGRDRYVFLRVPTYVIGYPRFNREAAARYLVRQFTRGGFEAQLVSDVDLYVSWIHKTKTKARAAPEPPKKDPELPAEFPTLMNLKKAASAYKRG